MKFFNRVKILLGGLLFLIISSCENENQPPIRQAIIAQLKGDTLVSYKILKTETIDNYVVFYSAEVKDSTSKIRERTGTIKFNKTGDGIWVYAGGK